MALSIDDLIIQTSDGYYLLLGTEVAIRAYVVEFSVTSKPI